MAARCDGVFLVLILQPLSMKLAASVCYLVLDRLVYSQGINAIDWG
jgi:hypothetical protein